MDAAAPPARPAYTHQQIVRVVGGIALCILLSALDQTIVAPAIPQITREIGGFGDFSWIVAAYLLTSTAATPIIGKLSDIHGRRPLALAAIAVFAAASVLCGLAQSLPQLIAGRALQGIGGAGLIGMAHAAIADVVSPRERGRYQVYMSGMWGLASIGGPIVGGAMTEHLSWRAVFWVNLPLALAAWVLASRALRLLPPKSPAGARIDYPGAALLTAASTLCLLLIGRIGQDAGLAGTLGLLAAAVAALLALGVRERRAPEPMLPPRLFAEPTVLRGFALSFSNVLITFATTLLFALYAQLAHGVGAGGAGVWLVPYLLTFVALSFGGGRLSARLGRTRAPMAVAFALCALGLLLLASLRADSPLWLACAYTVLVGGGIGLVQPNITVTIQNACERRDVGVATGTMLLLRAIGGAFGAAMAGAIVADAMAAGGGPAALEAGFSHAFLAAALVALASLAVVLSMRDLALRAG